MTKIKKSEATRTRLLEAANRMLREKGYSNTRLQDIAKAAGTHAGAMYYYFASKDALVEELLDRNAAHSLEYVKREVESLPPTASQRDRIITAARAALSNVLGEGNDEIIVGMRILNEIPAEMRSRVLGHARISRHYVRDLIRKGQDTGEFRRDVNPTVVALMLLSNLVWAYDWFQPAANHSVEELARDMCHILLSGIENRDYPSAKQRLPAKRPIGRRTISKRQPRR